MSRIKNKLTLLLVVLAAVLAASAFAGWHWKSTGTAAVGVSTDGAGSTTDGWAWSQPDGWAWDQPLSAGATTDGWAWDQPLSVDSATA